MKRPGFLKLSALPEGDAPPSEFRIFAAGRNESTKGTAIFDAAAAEAVMRAWREYGNELPIDFCHGMLEDNPTDPAQAGKAAGWFRLELRNGELWAVNVRWTTPAAEALGRKEFRYTSPAFWRDEEGHVTEIVNVALTNTPAMLNQTPLMAASRVRLMAASRVDAVGQLALKKAQRRAKKRKA